MAEHQAPPQPASIPEVVYIYRVDPVTHLPVVAGKVFIDKDANAWVIVNATTLAEGIGVEDIDGVALMKDAEFQAWEPR